MTSLLAILPRAETVEIRGVKIAVNGVGLSSVASLLDRFPEFRKMMSGQDIDMAKLTASGGDLVSAIIAAGTGDAGDADAEGIAAALSIDEQVSLLEPILRLTLPEGVGPFVEKLNRLGAVLSAGSTGGKPNGATISPQPPNS